MNAEYKTVRLPQGTIRYRECGSGEPIVFVHGLLVSGSLWRKVVPLLARQYRCIVPDLPLGSHEVAMEPDADLSPSGLARLIAEFVAALDTGPVTLVGNDTGGALCQIVATEHPRHVARLVLTDCDCFENFPPPAFRPLAWAARVPGFLFLLAQLLRFDVIRRSPTAYGWLAARRIERDILDAWLRPTLTSSEVRRDLRKILAGISPKYTKEAARRLKDFARPVLVAWAPRDRFFPFAHARQLAVLIPEARLEPVDDSLTFVPEDQPERLAELIEQFMTAHARRTFTLSA
jgi:pimeloyl-ACP methyl ester carboxylesterase